MLEGYVKHEIKKINNQPQKVNKKFPEASIIIIRLDGKDIFF